MTTASAIKDALITNLGAASVFGSNQVATHYHVMEQTSACCCVIRWAGYNNEAMTFGNNRTAQWDFVAEIKLKDTGDPYSLMNNSFGLIDTVISSLKSDDTLQGQCKAIGAVSATRAEPGTFDEAGGAMWLPIDVNIEVLVWD